MKQRIEQLDSLRGLAALTVVICHFTNIFPAKFSDSHIGWQLALGSPLMCVMAGHQAVVFFFVLSGFVLSIPFYQRPVAYAPWIVKRFCRIYLPYYGAMLLAMLLVCCNANPIPTLSDWFNSTFQGPINGRIILEHLLLIGSFNNGQLNPIVWSLVLEMRISLLFPLLMRLAVRVRWWQSLVAIYGVATLGYFLFRGLFPSPNDYGLTFMYLPEFVVGCLLARYRSELVSWYQTRTRSLKGTAMIAAVLLYSYAFWFFPQMRVFHPSVLADDLVTTLGVAVFIVSALASSWVSSVLLSRPLVALGKASYSLYLVHAICLLTAIHLLSGSIPLWCILVISGVACLIVTGTFYFVLEVPSIELGRRLSALLAGRPTAPQASPATTLPMVHFAEAMPPPASPVRDERRRSAA